MWPLTWQPYHANHTQPVSLSGSQLNGGRRLLGSPGGRGARRYAGLHLLGGAARGERVHPGCRKEQSARAQKRRTLQDLRLGPVQTHRSGSGPAEGRRGRRPPRRPGPPGKKCEKRGQVEEARVCVRLVIGANVRSPRTEKRLRGWRRGSTERFTRGREAEGGGRDRTALAAAGEDAHSGGEESASALQRHC